MTDSSLPTSAAVRKSVGGRPPKHGAIGHNPQVPFRDHTDTPAIMVYCGSGLPNHPPPPPPFSIQVCVTNGLTAATAGLMPTTLRQQITKRTFNCVRLRLDVYFLPKGASADDCMVHYRAEKAARAGQPLPLVPRYANFDFRYMNFLLMVEREDWEDKGELGMVRFDLREDILQSMDEETRVAHRVLYAKDVLIQVPRESEWEWRAAHPGLTPVGQLCDTLYQSDWREQMEDKFEAEGRL